MRVGERIRTFREGKKLSQGDIEQRTGLLRCYISRVENGHTVPSVETLEKIARALEMKLYQLLYDGDDPPVISKPLSGKNGEAPLWGSTGKEARYMHRLGELLRDISEADRSLLMSTATNMVNLKRR